MAKFLDTYKCEACGNIIEVIHAGEGNFICCNKEMKHLVENTVDASKEKHVPVVEKNQSTIHVKVGSVAHPMEDKHFIEWIEVVGSSGEAYRQFLKPGQKPEAIFPITDKNVTVREYCNLHGLWKA